MKKGTIFSIIGILASVVGMFISEMGNKADNQEMLEEMFNKRFPKEEKEEE